jgi:hypothetical protein
VINVSSPNTPGLRKLQGRKQLQDLIKKVNCSTFSKVTVKSQYTSYYSVLAAHGSVAVVLVSDTIWGGFLCRFWGLVMKCSGEKQGHHHYW